MNRLIHSSDLAARSTLHSPRTPFAQLMNYRDQSNEEMDWSDSCLDTSALSPVQTYYPVLSRCEMNVKKGTNSTSPTSLLSSLNITEGPHQKLTQRTMSFPAFQHLSTSTPKLASVSSVGTEFQWQKENIFIQDSEPVNSDSYSANSRSFFRRDSELKSSLFQRKPFVRDEDVTMSDSSNNFECNNGEIRNAVEDEVEESATSDTHTSTKDNKCPRRVKSCRSCLTCLSFYSFLSFILLFCAVVIRHLYFENTVCNTNLNTTLVWHELTKKVFGQHLAIETVTESLELFLRGGHQEQNVLVLSFHGWTGIGKNHMSNILARFFPPKNVHRFVITLHLTKNFPGDNFENWVMSRMNSSCGIHLFVIDEMDKARDEMISGFKNVVRSMKEPAETRNGKAIFLLLSNTGSTAINAFTAEILQDGRSRESISYDSLVDRLQSATQHTWYDKMVVENLVDRTVPFLPLERRHVKKCVAAALGLRGVEQSDDLIAAVLERLAFFPPATGTFSTTGCRKVNSELDLLLF